MKGGEIGMVREEEDDEVEGSGGEGREQQVPDRSGGC